MKRNFRILGGVADGARTALRLAPFFSFRSLAVVGGAMLFLAGCLGVTGSDPNGSDDSGVEQPPPEQGYYDDLLALPTPTGSGSSGGTEPVVNCSVSAIQAGVPTGSTRYLCNIFPSVISQTVERQVYLLDVFDGVEDPELGEVVPTDVKRPARFMRLTDMGFTLITPTLSPTGLYLVKFDADWYRIEFE